MSGSKFLSSVPNLTAYLGLRRHDLRNLDFVADHFGMGGYSFVQSAQDMDLLIAELSARGSSKLCSTLLLCWITWWKKCRRTNRKRLTSSGRCTGRCLYTLALP
jgi:hypothetical protein